MCGIYVQTNVYTSRVLLPYTAVSMPLAVLDGQLEAAVASVYNALGMPLGDLAWVLK